jgi:class 3 adenylate cyclase
MTTTTTHKKNSLIQKTEDEKKTATICSGSFPALSALADDASPDETITRLNAYFESMKSSIELTGGAFTDMADGSIAGYWGIRATSGNVAHDALNAVRAALIARLNFLKTTNARPVEGKRMLPSACGINTGKIIAGNSKWRGKNAPLLIGQNAALAFKAREIAEKNNIDIVITAKTWRLVEQYVITEEIEPLTGESGKTTRLFALVNLRAKRPAEQPRPTTLKELQTLLGVGAGQQGLPHA